MKNRVDILYFGELLDVNGVNFVTNSFLTGKKYFNISNFELNGIYGYDIFVDCSLESAIPIGKNNIGITKKFYPQKKIIKNLLSKYLPFGIWQIFKNNFLTKASHVIDKYKNKEDVEFIIFQDLFTAYFYFKKHGKNQKKTILILHCGEHVFDQLFLSYPTLAVGYYKSRLDGIKAFTFDHVDKIIYLSKRAVSLNHKYAAKNEFVYNGLEDIDYIKPIKISNIINIVSVASMNYRKGHEILIEAIHHLEKEFLSCFKVFFIGSGPQEAELQKLVIKYGLENKIEFMGIRNDVPIILTEMDILILLSKSEGLPLCIIEGLRQGLYIIGTDVGGVSEMIEPKFGEIVEREPIAVHNLLIKIIKKNKINPEVSLLSRNSYENNFTLKSMINKYCNIFLTLK